MDEIAFGLSSLSIRDIAAVAAGARVVLDREALEGMRETQALIADAISRGTPIYGLTTGIGDLYSVALTPDEIRQTQLKMLRSHASGVGLPLDQANVRAIMATMIRSMMIGASGVSPELVETIAAMLNHGVTPRAPVGGSVGYLIATAHIGLAIFGYGEAWFEGELLSGAKALTRAGIAVREPGPREGHALISGTYEITGMGALALSRCEDLVGIADLAGAMSIEAMKGNTRGYDPRLHRFRPHTGQVETASRLLALLDGSEILEKYRDHRLQDALSLRCIPQVHGAVRDTIRHCRQVFDVEINSLTDNPVFVIEDGELVALPGGNGHGAPVAMALDMLAIAIASLSTISQARSDRLVSAHLSGLPAFLSAGGGSSAFSISPCVAAALSADNRALAAPSTVHTMSTVAGQEDHVSMGVAAARKAQSAVSNLIDILSVELLCAAQALDFHRPLKAGRATGAARDLIRTVVPFREGDKEMYPDLAAVRSLFENGRLCEVAS
ncbi:HAL/PAL/TAL family ammonia-lyase [Rhizobium rhizogenes]|uniref:HAL/PAL/TAL family ammonia-lyase n=1 Tax=Rhizobium rhizogenes TaxID=359 RepID=UPI0015736C08|nr:aromatic amino acid ammonia-lyase [Rhizobium rhizogenes]NTH22876.1 aromatic amino acid lyase [Rhizobium rhizogenes]NTH35905.1 aromatic amino acid lyase [Rhizobium rhizogenes]